MNTNLIGNKGLGRAISYFTSKGYIVSIPLNDSQEYDLIVGIDKILLKVQVKTTKYKPKGYYNVKLISNTHNFSKEFDKTLCDLLYVMIIVNT